MGSDAAASPGIHYHIRWLPAGKVDWERHKTRRDAENSAKQLSRAGEEYSIEQFDGACVHCQSFHAK